MFRTARQGGGMRPTVFVGLRGMGKTALLRHCLALARDDGAVVLEIEASHGAPLAVSLADAVASAQRQVSLSARVRDIFEKLTKLAPAASFDLPNDMGSIEVALRNPASPAVHRALGDLNSLVRRRGLYLVVAIDEVQEATLNDLREIIKVVHATAGTDEPIIFIGAGLTTSAQHLHEARTYTERWRFPRLRELSADETTIAIQEPARAHGVLFDEEALKTLVDETAGYPFFIQEYASVIWMNTEGTLITKSDVERMLPAIQYEIDEEFYEHRFARLTSRETAYALALADLGPGPHPVHAVATTFNSRSSNLSSLRNQLIKKEIAFASGPGMIEFRIPLTERYVMRNRDRLESHAKTGKVSLLRIA